MSHTGIDPDVRKAIMESVDRFCREQLGPRAQQIDDDGVFPMELYHQFADLGIFGLWVPEEDGGVGLDLIAPLKISERLARHNVAFAISVSNCGDCIAPIVANGSEEVKALYLPQILSGEMVPAFCLSEPAGGSDVAAMTSTAVRDGDDYILNGRKMWITSAPVAGVFVVFAKTDPAAGHKGITAFVVPRDAEGLSVGAPERLLGLHSSPTAEVSFTNVRVPVGNRLGEEGTGFRLAMITMDEARVNIACCALGAAATAVETAVEYSRERKQFGVPIIDHQGLGFEVADLVTGLATARAIVGNAVQAMAEGKGRLPGVYAAMAKKVASDFAMEAAVTATQVLGGYGLTRSYPTARLMRDCKALQIFEGTNEIQKWIISRELARNGLDLLEMDDLLA
ncbi:acyl-CoA dehydrogenase family protein [Paracoccus sp. AK26]|uniref:acyl-CoA dehydrogenase family protein n=1 Tax=Paracoccus sp. AK26 TaxID=2589076 RepID=UPI00142820C5|nr:acyl-CoA dehydrogenase family protein [Paracoccus sp. AK26]QIR86842.1 acyl-CoA dehydrogenase [Paracoccus sp. AK26]